MKARSIERKMSGWASVSAVPSFGAVIIKKSAMVVIAAIVARRKNILELFNRGFLSIT